VCTLPGSYGFDKAVGYSVPLDRGGPRDTHVSFPLLTDSQYFILGNPISNFWESLSYAGKSI